MNINYKRLFNLNLAHNYFEDGFDRFLKLTPTIETIRLMRNGKMLLKSLPKGITVLYRADDDEITPLVKLDDNQKFVFAITVPDISGLLAVSNFDKSVSRKYKAGNILLFKNFPASASVNSGNPEIITHEIIDSLKGSLFTYAFSILGNPGSVKLRVADAQGNLVSIGKDLDGTDFPTTISLNIGSNNSFSQQINLENKPKGKYTITILNNSETTTLKTEEIYVDDVLVAQNIIGVLEIEYDAVNGHLYGDTEEYQLQLNRKSTWWKYFIVNKCSNIDLTTEALKLLDSGSINGTPYSINQFNRGYAGILLTAYSEGTGGNLIRFEYAGSSDYRAAILSGETLRGGQTGVSAKGTISLIDNTISGYSITIGGFLFTEGTEFAIGPTITDTAASLIDAINNNDSLAVSASSLYYDVLLNEMPTLVFTSDMEIPFYEKPKSNIELQDSVDQVIVSNLPNPSLGGNSKLFSGGEVSEIFVFI